MHLEYASILMIFTYTYYIDVLYTWAEAYGLAVDGCGLQKHCIYDARGLCQVIWSIYRCGDLAILKYMNRGEQGGGGGQIYYYKQTRLLYNYYTTQLTSLIWAMGE